MGLYGGVGQNIMDKAEQLWEQHHGNGEKYRCAKIDEKQSDYRGGQGEQESAEKCAGEIENPSTEEPSESGQREGGGPCDEDCQGNGTQGDTKALVQELRNGAMKRFGDTKIAVNCGPEV